MSVPDILTSVWMLRNQNNKIWSGNPSLFFFHFYDIDFFFEFGHILISLFLKFTLLTNQKLRNKNSGPKIPYQAFWFFFFLFFPEVQQNDIVRFMTSSNRNLYYQKSPRNRIPLNLKRYDLPFRNYKPTKYFWKFFPSGKTRFFGGKLRNVVQLT